VEYPTYKGGFLLISVMVMNYPKRKVMVEAEIGLQGFSER